MTEERDIARFALPFSAGVLTACLLPATRNIYPTLALTVSVAASLYLTRHGTRFPWSAVIIAAFFCGIYTALTDRVSSYGWYSDISPLTDWARAFGQKVSDRIHLIPFRDKDTAGIISALITGDRSHLTKGITDSFRESGASHILALSGFHLGIIYGIISSIFRFTGNSIPALHLRSVLTMAFCGFYASATGGGESITRALLFICIRETGKMTGRSCTLKETLMTALVIQLSLSPSSVNSVSFQLSYAAMAGIAFIYPRLIGLWPECTGGLAYSIWKSAAMSISCQITTAPLAYFYFESFPEHFLLTNLIALPLVGILIPVALLTLVLHMTGICPDFMIQSAELLTNALTDSLYVIASM